MLRYHEQKVYANAAERFLDAQENADFRYGYQMIRFAKCYHELMLLGDELPGSLDVQPYPCDMTLNFVQKADEQDVWKTIYALLRRNGWQRRENMQATAESMLQIVLVKHDLTFGIQVSYPDCKTEVIGHETIQKPIYKITCGAGPIIDPFAADLPKDAPPSDTPF